VGKARSFSNSSWSRVSGSGSLSFRGASEDLLGALKARNQSSKRKLVLPGRNKTNDTRN